ncbi:peptidase S9, prolyl oligopeptidase active site domain protein [Shewanella sediminis HAW-EB3]|uniref:Peptidase S9, prolyl oligopeptidase active site domain protein n=1 Tax=Shewanella sediminis (strain HAW-EB3) TaxID=425104 RepID=A8FVU3_SHESH|nr:S9 family peptidase [Shewanella sediminis]ABV36966.1 peptidase S9, prolyl oligopeptidase active site domain protein [Shewanella sediminis HAW-EB3]
MKKTAIILAIASAGLSISAQAANPEPFTVQHLVKINKLHSPALSNDGSKIVYAVKKFDAEGESSSDLYIQDLSQADSKAKQLTSVKGTEHSVAFAADDQSIYFLAGRSGSSQLYKLSLNGGEAIQISDFPLDVEGFKLSQDGTQVVMNMRVFPECKDLKCSEDKFTAEQERKSSGREYKQLMVRHWDTWSDHSRSHLFVAKLNGEKIITAVDVTAGLDTETPPKPFSGMEEVTFTPDGKHLVYGAKAPGKDQAWITNYDLWQVPVTGGDAVNLTEANKAWDANPTFSADGRYLAYLAMTKPGFEADRYRIMLRDTVTGQEKEVAPLWDRSASSLTFGKDNRTLYVTAQDVGQVTVFEVNTQFGDVKTVYNDGSNSVVGVTNDKIIINHKSLVQPGDLYSMNLDGQGIKQLTQVNQEKLAEIKFGEFEQFSFKGWNNEEVHGYWIKPSDYKAGQKYPIAFLVHGGPQGSFGNSFSSRWNAQLWAGAGYGVVMIDFHGSTGYGQEFTDSISQDWGGKPLEDLQKGLAAVTKQQKWLDETRTCALGGSYGGYMMNWIQGNWSDGFNCLVNHAGLFDMRSMYYVTEELWFPEYEFGGTYQDNKELYEKFNPVNYTENWKTPMLVIHGEKDFRVPYGQGLAAFSFMQRKGIPSELLIYPEENHWILNPDNLEQWYANVLGWMDRWTEKK